ncbi:hypothetical protein HG15A2_01950 [Adhaeretor mobilis]|uniref:Uncharacterized protein n=1 Tax=Adhaeretor mobilis TaxID=1930276 RepID=A0A517MPW8_9BACT|nr:hypothetical protein HG15A2_01950 [Adhaeretor mobilis]
MSRYFRVPPSHLHCDAAGRDQHTGPPAYLTHSPLQRIVRANTQPVLAWVSHVAQRLARSFLNALGGLGQLHPV